MQRLHRAALALSLAAATLGLVACASVNYGDAHAVETVNTDFGSTDLHLIAEKMVDSLLAAPITREATASSRRPILFVERINNKTDQHIDTESVTDSISTKLMQAGKYRFVDMNKLEAVREQLHFQNADELSNAATAIKFGQMVGAEYMLYGNFSNISKRDGSTRDVYYKFTLKLMDLKTGLIEWQDEKEIRKTRSRGLFGR